jgi:hypothetical protein
MNIEINGKSFLEFFNNIRFEISFIVILFFTAIIGFKYYNNVDIILAIMTFNVFLVYSISTYISTVNELLVSKRLSYSDAIKNISVNSITLIITCGIVGVFSDNILRFIANISLFVPVIIYIWLIFENHKNEIKE